VSTAAHEERGGATATLVAVAVGALVSVLLGVYGRSHQPTGGTVALLGFDNLISMKVTLAFVALGLALVQALTALWMYGKLGLRVPARLGVAHRVTGTLALLVSLPVAYHCLWSLGFQTYGARVLLHSLCGCLVYGVFVAKVVGLHTHGSRWLVPIAGSLLFTVLVATVLTSALWYVTSGTSTY
jgi:hypothetical protein